MMRIVVLKVDISDDKVKRKALKAVHNLYGLESFFMDMRNQKLTITGDVDPASVVAVLRKVCIAEILYVGPVEHEAEAKAKAKAKEKEFEEKTQKEAMDELVKVYKQWYSYSSQPYYYKPEQQQPPYYMPQPYGPVYVMPVEQMRQPHPYPYPYPYPYPSSSSSQLSFNFSGNFSWQRSYW